MFYPGMHSILMKIESDANQQAAKAAAEAELQVNIAALQRHVDDLKQQKKQLSDSCKQSCVCLLVCAVMAVCQIC